MRTWNLTTGAARLELALETLQKARHAAAEHWDDAARARLEEEYLAALEPRFRRALDGIHGLQQILANAQRDCSEP